MGGEKVLLWSICLVIAIFLVVMLIDYFVLLHLKVDYDFLCQRYFWVCEQNNGLQSVEIEALRTSLAAKGYSNIVILAPIRGSVSRGQWINFSVSAERTVDKRSQVFERHQETMNFLYEQAILSRQVVN